jgi:ABC-type multidrug transport system ATPase subunit
MGARVVVRGGGGQAYRARIHDPVSRYLPLPDRIVKLFTIELTSGLYLLRRHLGLSTTASLIRADAGGTDATAATCVRDLSFSYGDRRALDGLSLEVPAGSVFGVLGPNGAGKSTLLSVLIGRRTADAGEVRVLGEPLSAGVRARVGMVFQHGSLDPHMTAAETMRLQGRLFGMPRGGIGERSRLLLERVGLRERAGDFTRTLSGGMRRRLELARALLPDPELILLDEPTLALDPDSRLALWEYLTAANRDGKTLLLATNDVGEAERYCDTVALIDEGRVVAQGDPTALKAELRRESVRVDWKHGPSPEVVAQVEGWGGVGHVRVSGLTTHVTVDVASPFLSRLFAERGDEVRSVHIDPTTLEDVYFQIVGKALHDEQQPTDNGQQGADNNKQRTAGSKGRGRDEVGE